MAKYKAVLFDLDDTLLITYPAKWRQHQFAAKHFYDTDLSEDTIRQHWGKPTREMVRPFYGSDDAVDNMVANYRSLSESYLKELHKDTVDILDYLTRKKVLVGLVTNANLKTVLDDLSRLGVAIDRFGVLQTFDDTQTFKPDPKVFKTALHTLAAKSITDGILYVGDDITDFRSAQAAGIDFIGVTTGTRTKEEFYRAGAKNIISRLAELPEMLI
jgi:HAD superfamily hydrolase (TIGR01549 family)